MRTSIDGLFALAVHEGLVPAPYIDPVGVWTFGLGHAETSGLSPRPSQMPRGMPADIDGAIKQAFDLFRAKIGSYEDAVSNAVTVPLAQHEFDALVSFHFNTGAIRKASATKSLNAGDKADAARRLGLYNKGRIGGVLQVLPGLVRRREEEQAMFLRGVYPDGPIPVWDVGGSNRVGRIIRRITRAEANALLGRTRPPPAPQAAPTAPTPATNTTSPLAALFRALLAMLRKGGK